MNFKIFNGRNAFYQWDINQKLIVEGLTVNHEVHFKNIYGRNAMVVKPYVLDGNVVVDVPNILLQHYDSITVWAYVDEHTKEQGVFKVIPRQKPADYVYTETEILSFKALEEEVKNNYATKNHVHSEYLTSETDPNVCDWAKESSKSEYEITGNPVTLENFEGMPLNVVTVLEPKQEGSGDPYPAGGGRNLLNNTATTQTVNGVTFTVNADGTVNVDGTATDGNAVFRIPCRLTVGETYTLSGCPAGGSQQTYFVQLGYFGNDTGSGVTATATEQTGTSVVLIVMSGVTVSDLIFYPMIEEGDAKTGWQPYSNIRPITGYDKLNLNVAGKNLFKDTEINQYPANGTIEDGKITITALNAYSAVGVDQILHVNTDYHLSFKCSATSNYNVRISYSDNGGASWTDVSTSAIGRTFNTGNHTLYRFSFYSTVAISSPIVFSEIQLELGSTSSAYEAYKGELHTLQIGQTVYGGKIDWNKGKLIAEWTGITFDGTEAWIVNADASSVRFVLYVNSMEPSDNSNDVLCSHYKITSWAQHNNSIYFDSVGKTIYVNADDSFTLDTFKAYLAAQHAAGTPVQIIYKLAEPIEIQFEPHYINALEGTNILYGDGELTVSGNKNIISITKDLLERIKNLESAIKTLESAAVNN